MLKMLSMLSVNCEKLALDQEQNLTRLLPLLERFQKKRKHCEKLIDAEKKIRKRIQKNLKSILSSYNHCNIIM